MDEEKFQSEIRETDLDQISRPKTKIIEYLTRTDRPAKSMEWNEPTYSSIFQAIRSIFPEEKPQPVNEETIHPRPEAQLDEPKFYAQLAKHEGFSEKVYKDSEGFDTIGFGHKVRPGEDWSKGITREEAKLLLQQDAAEAIGYARTLPYWEKLNDMQQNVVAEMIFNLGFEGFKKFKKTNKLLEQGKFDEASKEMLNSKWAKQVKGRAITLANQMKE